MASKATNAGDGAEYGRYCRELCRTYVRNTKSYAKGRIMENIRQERAAAKKESSSSASYLDPCLRSLEAIVNAKSNEDDVEDIVIPADPGVPKYQTWIPVKDGVLFYDQEDSLFRLPQVQDNEDVATKSLLAKDENFLDMFDEAWNEYELAVGNIDPRVKTAREEYYNLRISPKSKDLLTLKSIRKEDACCKVIKKLYNDGYDYLLRDKSLTIILAEALSVPEKKLDALISRAKREVKEFAEMLDRKKRRKEFRMVLDKGIASSGEADSKSASCSRAVSAAEGLIDETWKNFCFVCEVFHCEKHNYTNYPPVIPVKDVSTSKRLAKLEDDPVPCSSQCFCLTFDDSKRAELLPSERKPWTNEEVSMLAMAVPVFHHDPCSLAVSFESRSCREVFAQLEEPRWKKWLGPTIERSEEPREVIGTNLDDYKDDINLDADNVDNIISIPCNHEGKCTEDNCPCAARDAVCTDLCACANHRCCQGRKGTGIAISVPRKCESEDEFGMCMNMERPCDCEPGGCRDDSCHCWGRLKACDSMCGCQRNAHLCNHLVTKECACELGKCVSPPCGFLPFSMLKKKRVIVGKSPVHGYGLFAGEFIGVGEFIGIYSGLMLHSHYSELLGFECDAKNHTFLFDLTRMLTIDATIVGSALKFINHQSSEQHGLNCISKKQFHRGHPSVAYFATRDIRMGEELFIDYQFEKNQMPVWMSKGEDK